MISFFIVFSSMIVVDQPSWLSSSMIGSCRCLFRRRRARRRKGIKKA